ncbi:MAG TPA: hypothetical protein VH558_10055 [Pseudolabrys sp.]|jgi:hypothetical protein
MAILLLSVGTLALLAGLVMVGFGIPINEFSFGNTLISAGTTAAVGGLIVIALGVTVGQLRRIAELLTSELSDRFSQSMDLSEAIDGPSIGGSLGVAVAPRSRPEANLGSSPSIPVSREASQEQAPMLRNPEEAPIAVEDEISLSPPQPTGTSVSPGAMPAGLTAKSPASKNQELAAGWKPSSSHSQGLPLRPLEPAKFDAMWPAEAKPPKAKVDDAKQSPPARDPLVSAPKQSEPEAAKPRAVAILKSGVVDGMGYTLYVDGSIEAELPQGTLRFASIHELRSHLEKNS